MRFVAPLLTTIVFSIVFFGGFARFVLGYVFFWNDRLGAPNWPLFLVASAVCAGLVARYLSRVGYGRASINSVVLGTFLVFSVFCVGTYAELLRRQAMAEFAADREFQNLFWVSLRNAPTDFQFFLHAGAMKDCVPYAWSYREMSLYELNESVMFNVLPATWFDECETRPSYRE